MTVYTARDPRARLTNGDTVADDHEWGSDMEDMGPGDVPEPGPDEPDLIEEGTGKPPAAVAPASEGQEGGESEERHGFKQTARETVGWAVGKAVEVGSVLGGQGGEIVSAEREIAEAETEELIDRVDGEDE